MISGSVTPFVLKEQSMPKSRHLIEVSDLGSNSSVPVLNNNDCISALLLYSGESGYDKFFLKKHILTQILKTIIILIFQEEMALCEI